MPDRINHLAVWVAAIAYYAFGALWYSALFGNAWQALAGKGMTSSPTIFGASFVLGLILAYATGVALARHPEDQTVGQGISFALFMGIAVYATQTLNTALYAAVPLALWAIDAGYVVIGFAIIGAIVGGWEETRPRRGLARGAFLAGAAAPAFFAARDRARAQGLRTFKAGGVPEESIVTALWAEQSGYFRRYGFDLQVEAQRSGSVVASAVAGGAYAIGKSSLVALIAAHAHGVPFVIVAPGGLYDSTRPNNALLVKSDSPIHTAADLNGKTLGVSSLNDLYTVATKAWVDDHGGDSSTLKLVELPIDAVGAALATGRIDATSIGTPQLEEYLASGTTRILGRGFDAIAPLFMFSAWFTTRNFAVQNPTVVQGFARGIHEAAVYVNAHHQQTIEVIAKFTGIDPGVIAKMQRAPMGTTLDPKLVQPVIDRCAKYKVIPAAFPAAEFLAR